MKKVYVFMADGFEEMEALSPIDVLRRAGAEVVTVSVMEREDVMGAHNVCVRADELFEDCNFSDADALVLPGGAGHKVLLNEAPLLEELKKAYSAGKIVAAVCAAPMILGTLGFLKGRKATCFPGFEQYLEGATYTHGLSEIDGNVVTGRSAGAAFAFSISLVEALFGKEKAEEIEKAMMA